VLGYTFRFVGSVVRRMPVQSVRNSVYSTGAIDARPQNGVAVPLRASARARTRIHSQWRLGAFFFDRPLVIGFSSSWHASSLRGFPTKLDSLSSSGLEFSTAYLLKWLAPFKSRFTNVLHALALVELSIAGSPRTLALCASTVSSSSCRANTCCRRSPLSSSSSLEGRREEDFSRFFSWQAATPGLEDARLPCPYFSLRSVFENGRFSHAPCINCEKAFDDTHPGNGAQLR